ncbi:TIGR03620 family F420-dependent LLM class oxidoreductase [Microbacterium rhizomatis]|uniref:TIGR03620 family F420-dependent LLM class oxidoreductase n=1 Tax=Microbacterium rhizomatis TaxID=1631477 RepID=A0A5J5J3F4_9MICO|nr:TIGR03620 family F420-dependent LLM class oxidoreductase [Microbacterium rhizomatis]KAA9107738.1 TIGR03620 family F420-dependent LLM class oxidoreductase [Microbacterium rhizomatis]
MSLPLGTVGVWRGYSAIDAPMAAAVEALGYGAIWQGSSPPADLHAAEQLLDATERVVVATGIVNIWKADPVELAASFHRIEARHPGRMLLGIGTGHREATPERVRPIAAMNAFLDVLDAHGVPVEARVLSALGPRMIRVAAERSAGTHPYLTVPAQTAEARAALGPDAIVAPEQTVVLDEDVASARATARRFLANYLKMSNYTSNMQRGGFADDDIAAPGSDHLVDEIVAHGTAGDLATAVRAHLDAGADHVCVQVLPASSDVLPALARISSALGLR